MCDHCGCDRPETEQHAGSPHTDLQQAQSYQTLSQQAGQAEIIRLHQDLLHANNHQAGHNRDWFVHHHLTAINLVSSPGAGKTTLLEQTLRRLNGKRPVMVIEGDQQTERDAERIRATGTPAVQIQTGQACHLDAAMVHRALHRLPVTDGGLLMIENVGNLICPALFDLGEQARVVLVSVTEGDDKPLKYPHIFADADLLLITKTDLLPYVQFDPDQCLGFARQIRPELAAICLSATSGKGMADWLNWLEKR